MRPINDIDHLNAAFLRLHDKSEPLRVPAPESVLMVHTSDPGLGGTLVVSRVDLEGRILWSSDTGLDRFLLQQILPATDAFAFVGNPPAP